MNQPHQSLTIEQLTNLERGALDAISAIGMALAHGVILGVNLARIQSDDGTQMPVIAVFVPGETSPDGEAMPIGQMKLTIPKHGQTFMGLLTAAGGFCHEGLQRAQERADIAVVDYFQAKAEVDKVRRNAKARIIVPGAGRN